MAGPAFGTNVGQDFTFLTITDLSAKQFTFVSLGTDGYLATTSSGTRATGVLQSTEVGSTAVPKGASVRTAGTSKIVAGGSFNAGTLLSSNSTGQAVEYTAATQNGTGATAPLVGSQVLGVAVESGVTGSLTTILFQPSGLSS